MANDARKVRVGAGKVGGYLFSAALGTALPTDAREPLDDGFRGLGYVSNDGITRTVEVSTEDIQDMNLDIVRTINTDVSVQISSALLEVNADLLVELYGEDNVTVTPASSSAGEQIAVKFTAEQLPRKSYVIELVDGDDLGRFVIPEGQVITPGGGELVFAKNQAIQHTLTVRAYRDASGDYFHHYTDDGQFGS